MRATDRGQHAVGRPWLVRLWTIAAAVVLLGAGAATAIVLTRGPSAAHVRAQKAKKAAVQQAALQAADEATQLRLASDLSVSPAAGASDVALNEPVSVSTSWGTLASVQVMQMGGSALTGRFVSGHEKWEYTGALAPSATYEVLTTIDSPSGVSLQKDSTFKTLTPVAPVTATVFPTDGVSVGVGQPIVIKFDQYIEQASSQDSIMSHFKITESKPVPGGWHWFSQDELHFRPESFWPTGEQVTITGNLDGWNAGGGEWGSGQISESFSVGDSRISYANLATDEMTVTLNGATVGTYPISGGRPEYPTMDGTHIVLDKEPVVHMVSSTVGIPVDSPNGYDEYVYNDVHISDSGEYVHAAPWSVADQGVINVSHGCINLSDANSLAFYAFSEVGDVVEVTGSPRPPVAGDHGVMDWSTPWSEWTPGVVHSAHGAPPASTTTTTTSTTVAPTTTSAVTSPPAPVTSPPPPATTTTTVRPKATTTTSTTVRKVPPKTTTTTSTTVRKAPPTTAKKL